MPLDQSSESTLILYEILRKIDDNSLSLASQPDFIIKVNEALIDERKTLRDVATIIQREISLSARIIRISNSPALRGATETSTVFQAIQRLGLSLIKNLAVCVAPIDRFTSTNLANNVILSDLIDTSIRTSTVAYMISEHMTTGVLPESALVAGLVSKIGELVTLRYLDDHPKYHDLPPNITGSIVESVGGEITLHLLRKWEFPLEILDFLYGMDPVTPDILTRKGIFNLTRDYMLFTDGEIPATELLTLVDKMINNNQEEVRYLTLVLQNS